MEQNKRELTKHIFLKLLNLLAYPAPLNLRENIVSRSSLCQGRLTKDGHYDQVYTISPLFRSLLASKMNDEKTIILTAFIG